MIASAILCDRSHTIGTLGDKQIPRNCWVKSIEFTGTLMPWLVTLKATLIRAHSAAYLSLAHALRAPDQPFTVCCSAPLEIFVLSHNDVLVDCLEYLELLRSHMGSHVLNLESFFAVHLHATDCNSVAVINVR